MSKYLGNRSQLPHLAAAVGALIIYGLVLALAGDLLAPLGLEAREGILFVPLYGALIIYPAYRLSGWVGTFAALSATLLFFAIPLIGFWDTGGTSWFAFGGIVPSFDGMIYYYDAQRLVEGFDFSFYSARRPWLAGTVAALLLLWQHHLHWVIASLVAFTALSTFLLARELRRTHGPLAVTILLIIVVFFSREWLGFVYTEHLGLAFGMLAMAFLWRSATDQQAWMVVAGMGLLMLGLLARAGTFFIIPALLIWVWLFFRNEGQRVPWRLLGSVVGVLVLAVGLNMLLIRALGPEESRPVSNFSYTLYGIASGGKGWNHINIAHPEVWEMEEPELSAYIYQRSFELLREHPENFLIAYSKGLISFLSIFTSNSIVGYIPLGEAYVGGLSALRTAFFLLFLSGCIWSIWYRRTLHGALLFCGFIGILASLSFAPPIDAVHGIKYAASVPFLFLLMAIGCVNILRLLQARSATLSVLKIQAVAADPGGTRPLMALAISSIIFMIGGSLLTQIITQPAHAAQPQALCAAGETQYLIRANTASATTVFAPDQEPTTRFFEEYEDAQKALLSWWNWWLGAPDTYPQHDQIIAHLSSMPKPFNVFRTVDLEQGRLLTIIMKKDIFEDQPPVVYICGEVVKEPRQNVIPENWYVFVHDVHAPTAGTP